MIIQQSSYFLNQEFSCRIPHYSMVEKKVVYVVTFISHSYLLVKVHRMRYSDAEKLHTKVLKTIEQLRITASIPAFPGKRLFGSHNDTKQGILTRKTQLQEYFNNLLREEKLYSLPCLKNLLPDVTDEKSELQQLIADDKTQQQYNFQIDSYQQLEDRVLYFVQVIDNCNKLKWRFKARYSDLRDIHDAIKGLRKNLPDFPKRRIFGITNEDPIYIEQRKKGLEQYLNQVFSDKDLASSEVLDYFIQNSKRESRKLQKYDEQKMLLKMVRQLLYVAQKMKAKQKSDEKVQNAQDRKSDVKLRSNPRKGLFVIKELLGKYEDDNTTLVRYSSLSLNKTCAFSESNQMNDAPINKALSMPLHQDDIVNEQRLISPDQFSPKQEQSPTEQMKDHNGEMWILDEAQTKNAKQQQEL